MALRNPVPDGCADGETYEHDRDHNRLALQRVAVWDCIVNGAWWTLAGIAQTTGHPEASVSARLRDFRKEKFGNHIIERRYVEDGLWEYRVNDPPRRFPVR